MQTAAIKMKRYVNNVNIVDNDNLQKRMFHMALLSLGVLAICYVFIIGNTVFNIVERKALESNARALSNEVRDLELVYLSMSSKIDLSFSHEMGFKETDTQFATRKSLKSLGVIGFVQNEI
jgi:hypothetical protein